MTRGDREWSYLLSHTLIPGPMGPGYVRNCTIYCTLIQSIYCWGALLQPSKVLSPNCHSHRLWRAYPSFYQASCFRMVGNMAKPVDSMIAGSLGPSGREACTTAQICWRAFFLFSSPIQSQQLSESRGIRARVTYPSKESAVSRIQTSSLIFVLSWFGEEWRVLPLRKNISVCSIPLTTELLRLFLK